MSRLDSMIRRLCAQRDCLNHAVVHAPEGDFLEIGLGNGRTYHHLRELAPERRIWVIDREMNAHPSSAPPDTDFLRGEADMMLKDLTDRIDQGSIALAHYDLGIGLEESDRPLRESLAPLIIKLLHPKGLLVANMAMPGLLSDPLPETVPQGRYSIQRFEA